MQGSSQPTGRRRLTPRVDVLKSFELRWLEPGFTAPVLDVEVDQGSPAEARVELRLGEPPERLQSADPLQGLFRGQ